MRVFDSNSNAYMNLMSEILNSPQYISSPRGMEVNEILDLQYKVLYPDSLPIITSDSERNKVIEEYTAKELDWYKNGDISVESAAAISKFWNKLSNPDGTVNSNYGFLIFKDASEGSLFETAETYDLPIRRTPYEWALQSLIKDKDSRQSLVRINKPKHLWNGNRDIVCTLHIMFHIRNHQLNISICQRSCDLKTGFVYDVPFFSYVQEKMLEDLLAFYPDLTKGTLTHTIHSAHIYSKDFDSIKKMID